MIDDCKIPGLNLESATTSAHRPFDIDAGCAMLRLVAMRYPVRLQQFASDFKAAYRQVPSCPRQMLDFIIVSWDPVKGKQAYAMATANDLALGMHLLISAGSQRRAVAGSPFSSAWCAGIV